MERRLERWGRRARKALRTPPRVLVARAGQEARMVVDRFTAPGRAARFNGDALLRATSAASLESLWDRLARRPYPAITSGLSEGRYAELCPGDRERIIAAAEDAVSHCIDLLGSGPVDLGERIDWLRDYKTGLDWPLRFFHDIDYNNPERPSDVKFPWEVSRMQWLIPAGQAYVLTGDERYADAVRGILEDWIDANPYAYGVNWACTMEVAIRIITWTWLFHVFNGAVSWQESGFRQRFLRSLYLHGEFTAGHLERSDVNGNHYTGDAVGLVFVGLFFGAGRVPRRWQRNGWAILRKELPRQVHGDGVDFEASAAYHRLVAELFLVAALYRRSTGLEVPQAYSHRLSDMARFTAAYTAPDGQAPLWGDADDARVLPFGDQDINDHRYLCGLVGLAFEVQDLKTTLGGSRAESVWWFGAARTGELSGVDSPPASRAFPEAGVYVMRNGDDHVFADCGPVGLAGRGGHGHNDCLSFEAWLAGVKLVTDSGAYLYTASYEDRNRFRSTCAHNTPIVDGQEINRFPTDYSLWTLRYDAEPMVHEWTCTPDRDVLEASHTGYRRLEDAVNVTRLFLLDKRSGVLTVRDEFRADGHHVVEERLHLDPAIDIETISMHEIFLHVSGQRFSISWVDVPEGWRFGLEQGQCSSSYGVTQPTTVLKWKREGQVAHFSMHIASVH